MHLPIFTILHALRQDLADRLNREAILAVCHRVGHRWRRCVLDPAAIVHTFVLQLLHGNTALTHLPHLTRAAFTASAFCQARARLPLAVFQTLVRQVAEAGVSGEAGRWRGHRVFLLDGTGVSMPDTPALQAQFGQPSEQRPGCGFPVAHLLALFHAGSGMLLDLLVAPLRSHDLSYITDVHPHLSAGDVLVGDRAFGSFAHVALLVGRAVQGVFRVSASRIVDFTPHRLPAQPGKRASAGRPRSRWLRRVGATDQVVAWRKPAACPPWLTRAAYAALPTTVTVRELRYRITQPGFRTREVTLVTTLLDAAAYPLEALAALYRTRWAVELNLRHLKQTLRMDVLHCETVAGVQKELLVFALVYNLVRAVMQEAAHQQQVPLERVSFIDALRWLATATPATSLPPLQVNPDRPDRVEPRVVKRRPKSYALMTRPRAELRQRLKAQAMAA
jgi:hypothetical protein